MAEKAPGAFRTISEVAEEVRVPAHVLRFWESRFTQIRPVKRTGGRRYYRPEDVELIAGIKRLLHDHGMTIRGVQKLLKDHGIAHVAGMGGTGSDEPGGLPAPAPFAPPPALAPSLPVAETERRHVGHYHAAPLPRPPVRPVAVPADPGGDGSVVPALARPDDGSIVPALTRPAGAQDGATVAGAVPPLCPKGAAPAAGSAQPHRGTTRPVAADPPDRPRLSLSSAEAGPDPALTAAAALALLFATPARAASARAERLRPIVARLAVLRDRLAMDPPANPPL